MGIGTRGVSKFWFSISKILKNIFDFDIFGFLSISDFRRFFCFETPLIVTALICTPYWLDLLPKFYLKFFWNILLFSYTNAQKISFISAFFKSMNDLEYRKKCPCLLHAWISSPLYSSVLFQKIIFFIFQIPFFKSFSLFGF